jgi:uncharacterized repeat protein (TIGR03803 family)
MRFAGRIRRGSAAALALAFIATLIIGTLIMAPPAQAQTESVIYSFCSLTNCADGSQPLSNVIMDAQGNLYGTTSLGETDFKLGTDGTLTVLYTYCPIGGKTCTDGTHSGLVRDSAGNLYGTTDRGGVYNQGTVFKLSSDGTLTTLYAFHGNTDGLNPDAGLLRDSAGNLYGTTLYGGKYYGGTIYRVDPAGKKNIMHSFGATSTDGANPGAVVPVMDRFGNLYGTTQAGGTHGDGTVFEITAGGAESVLYNFGDATNDGINPLAGLAIDSEGDLYGTTTAGGTYSEGTVFRVTHNGTETVIHNFQNNGTDGYNPSAPVVLDASGNLYGVTNSGGRYGFGTVFGVDASGVETILHAFANNGTDGTNPVGGLLLDSAGNLYGTTQYGGAHKAGTVFEVVP